MSVADIFGQNSERLLGVTGWIGEHPATGTDVAHLLVYPFGNDVAARMRALADLLELAEPGAMWPTAAAVLTLDRDTAGDHAQIRGADRALLFERPVSTEWAAVAAVCGRVVLTLGQDGYDGSSAKLERYLARANRLRSALVAVDADAATDGSDGR